MSTRLDFGDPADKRRKKTVLLDLVHPGHVLGELYMEGYGLTAYRVASDLGVRPPVIYELVKGKRSLTAPLALRLARYFSDTTPEFWLALQARYDVQLAEREIGKDIATNVKPLAA